jgi:hypothetical protein
MRAAAHAAVEDDLEPVAAASTISLITSNGAGEKSSWRRRGC